MTPPSGLIAVCTIGSLLFALFAISNTRILSLHTVGMSLGAFQFEVSGRVQGVYFRKFTVDKAKALRLVGWVANTIRGTVVGECQGPVEQLKLMKDWLCTEGSPSSHIEDCLFTHERQLQQLDYEVFERRKNVP